MLVASPVKAGFSAVAAASVVSACWHTIPPFIEQVQHRSDHQSLVVVNSTGEPIYVVPAGSGMPNVEIADGSEWTMQFSVVTVASLDDEGIQIDGSQYNRVEPLGGADWLTLQGVDWVLTAGPSGEQWEHELYFGECWFTKPAGAGSHRLEVAMQPGEGEPVSLCPGES